MLNMMRFFGALTALACVADAGVIKRQITPPITMSMRSETGNFSQTISEANDLTVSFYLNEPIICPPEDRQCRVVILLHNSRPDELVLSSCHVIWNHYDSYLEPRNVTISTVENFIDDGQRRFHIGTQVNSSTELYRQFPLPEMIIHTEPKNVATCSSTTDPNYRQFDGGNFVINTAGTFNLWRAPLRDWEVQSRVNSGGFNCGVALRDGCDRYVVDRCSGTLVMRQYPGGASDGLEPRVTRENGDTYVFTSQRAGAVVRVRERIRINRHGRSICGWSGCRVVYHTTRTEWLDITMTAPGRDWGFVDNTETPRTSGVCGHYDGVTMAQGDTDDCHVASAVASNSAACSSFVSNHRVQGANLFDETPTPCATPRPVVVHNYDMCELPPRAIQRPVLQTHDIEDITELILRERPEDRGDERINYDFFEFEGQPFIAPSRPDGFSEAAMVYCRNALLNTQAARLCEALNVDVEVFVTNCHNDMMFQANNSAFTPGAETDDRHMQLAAAQLEEMQSTCITDAIRRRENIQLTCDEQAECEVACVEQDSGNCINTCIGDCRITFNNNDLESLVDTECPDNCGNGFAVNGTVPGTCVRNAEGRNVCACSEGFAGNDCSIMTAELPTATRLFPFVCDIVGGACPQNIAIEGEEYYRTESVACRVVDGDETYEMNATVISSTIIRCEMPDIVHSGAAVKTVQVSMTLDGEVFSEPLPFMYRDQRCRNCTRTGDCNTRVAHTCIIDNGCHMHEQPNPSNPDCQVCDSAAHPFGWSFRYAAAQCGPTISQIGTTVRIQESQQVGQAIQHAGVLPFRLSANPYTDADDVTRTLWSLANGDAALFSVASSGSLSLRQPVDYEGQRTFSFTLTASRGGLEHSMEVNLEVVNVDEEATFSNLPYSAQIAENSRDDNLLTVSATDPDDEDTAFGAITYSLRSMNADGSALQHFAINPTTGVVRITNTLNYEDGATRHFQVAATTGAGATITQAIEVTVLNVNEAPTAVRLSQIGYASRPAMTLTESMTRGDVVGQLTVVDPDRTDTHTLVLVDNADGRFRINSENQLEVASAAGFDYESLASGANRFFTVTVRATDALLESFDQELLLTITDGNDAPQTIALFGYNPATLSATGTPLGSIPEDQPLGVVGIFTVEDQDTEQTHAFTIEAPDSQSPFRIVGNELRLVRPLNYEDIEAYALRVFATDNGEPAMRSATQDFGIAVGDRPDLPGYFQFTAAAGAAGVSELSAVGAVIGTVSGLDQDLVQNFEIHLADGSTGVAIGATTCVGDADDYTNCSAPVTLTAPIDFESNRVSATASVLLFTVQATDGGGAGVGTGELYMPIINGNDQPSGVLVESLITGVGPATMATAFQIEEGQTSLPRVARLHASDADDSCPADLEGCQSFTATGAYSFDLVAQSSTYRLTAECAERRTVASRMASGRHCELVLANANAAVTAGQGSESVQIRVTDQTGLSVVQTVAVTVVAPVVRLSVTFDSVSESVVQTSGTVVAAGSLGELVLSGWTESAAPSVTLTGAAADLFVLSSADGRRRDAARSLTWSVAVAPGANIDFETMPTVNFSVAVAAVGDDFVGLGFWTSLAVTDEAEMWRSVVCVSGACLPASEQNVRLHDDAAAGTAVATLQFANPEDVSTVATPFWRITRTVPSTATNPIFQIDQDTGVITTTRTADEAALENGAIAIEVSVVDSSAPDSSPRSDRLTVTVTIYDDCSDRTCSMEGECRDQANAYVCVCNLGRGGRNCEQVVDDPVELADAMESDNESSSTGTVVGIFIALLFAILLVVGVVLFMREKQAKDRMVMSQIQASVNPTYETVDEDIVQGVSNPMYAWYKPGMSKQSAYQDLATAQPGTFVVRDGISSLDNPMYCLHVKTPQALIKDVNINGAAGEVTLVGGGANQPGFDTLPQLVDYYSNPTDQPFVLSTAVLVAPISGMDIYDNALITNKKVDAQGPLVPKKMINFNL
jgi:VCBS repeat-containing protein